MMFVVVAIAMVATTWIRRFSIDDRRSVIKVSCSEKRCQGKPRRRNAEKRRHRSTCDFADEIASASIALFERVGGDMAPSRRKTQTVMSTFCATFSNNKLRVLSMGVGTKIRDEKFEGNGGLNDMHAEVLARRGFQRYLLNEMLKERSDILERNSSNNDTIFQLRENVKIHQYTSSAPCGNATIRRWGVSKKLKHSTTTETLLLPNQIHNKINLQAIHEGQISTLVKTFRHRRNEFETKQMGFVKSTEMWSLWQQRDNGKRTYSSRGTSCAPVWTGLGTIMTCSDKIAKWNALGLQGSLLTGLMSRINLSSLTCGRKFNFLHCRRALCCRLVEKKKKKSKKNIHQINHPILMETSIPMDNSEIELDEQSEGGANFSDSRCLIWIGNEEARTVLISGDTGLVLNTTCKLPCISHDLLYELRNVVLKTLPQIVLKDLDIALQNYKSEKSDLLSRSTALRDWVRVS